MNDTDKLSEKDQADIYVAMAQSAQQRFETHHGVEWKINFGLWAFFVAGAALVPTQDWTPTGLGCLFLSLLSVGLVAVYCFWWLPHSQKYREECTRSRWWWEMHAWKLIPEDKRKLPTGMLAPDYEGRLGGWPLPGETAQKWDPLPWTHPSQWMSAVVTQLFAGLFLAAIWEEFLRKAEWGGVARFTAIILVLGACVAIQWVVHDVIQWAVHDRQERRLVFSHLTRLWEWFKARIRKTDQ